MDSSHNLENSGPDRRCGQQSGPDRSKGQRAARSSSARKLVHRSVIRASGYATDWHLQDVYIQRVQRVEASASSALKQKRPSPGQLPLPSDRRTCSHLPPGSALSTCARPNAMACQPPQHLSYAGVAARQRRPWGHRCASSARIRRRAAGPQTGSGRIHQPDGLGSYYGGQH